MASIANDPNGRRRILFVAPDGRRKTVRLGRVPKRAAETIRVHIEHLAQAVVTGAAPPDATARWVANLDEGLHEKLARVGLVGARRTARLGEFLAAYLESRADVKPGTATFHGHARRNLLEFLGRAKPLRDITPGDADDWRSWLINHEGLAPNTVRRRVSMAKQFFRSALRKRLIPENPFDGLGGAVRGNPERQYFVTREEADRVLEACPDAQWRLLFAFSRWGGLRCPSEHLALRWQDVDWEHDRLTIHSPKTEHHPGGASRVIPIFPELRPHLETVWEQAAPGTEFVITRYRQANVNLRTQLLKIIKRAGLTPWPKLFHNLRATRQTELEDSFPSHVVCKWIGNSRRVANEHYLQVTDEHYAKAAQNPAQYMQELPGKTQNDDKPAHEKTPVLQAFTEQSRIVHKRQVGDDGLEPPTSTV